MAPATRRSARLEQKRPLASNLDDPSPPSARYDSLKVSELRELLRRRDLPVSGIKSTLVERLTTADELPASATSDGSPNSSSGNASIPLQKTKRARKKSVSGFIPASTPAKTASHASDVNCLPRTREHQLLSAHKDSNTMTDLMVIGVDEAGRGPLAGPVVAAAAIVPANIAGIVDSKKITKEDERERIFEELIASPSIRYAVAVVSAQRIDEINILQATLEGMRMAVEGVIDMGGEKNGESEFATAERNDLSYVVTGGGAANFTGGTSDSGNCNYFALIDGNKTPKEMPCPCESLTKGDGREYSIGAASILAKVTRDRLMREYDEKYPEYDLGRHKGYPTAAHMGAVRKYGASPIHRRTFAPLKHMEFDGDGKVIG